MGLGLVLTFTKIILGICQGGSKAEEPLLYATGWGRCPSHVLTYQEPWSTMGGFTKKSLRIRSVDLWSETCRKIFRSPEALNRSRFEIDGQLNTSDARRMNMVIVCYSYISYIIYYI